MLPLVTLVPSCYPCYLLLPLVTPCSPLLPLVPLVTPCYSLLLLLPFVTRVTPCFPLLPLVPLCYPFLPPVIPVTFCYPLFSLLPLVTLVTFCYPLLRDVNTSRLSYDLRSSGMNLIVLKARTNYLRTSFASAGAKLCNSLPCSLKEETSLTQFKAKIRSYYLSTQTS